MENLVSIIIPVYNSEKFLKESIKSVLNQTYQKIEIIVIDDGSTDNSLEILQQFKNELTIIHQENQGLASALNEGIKQANGKWFKWFSPDDIMCPLAIETLVDNAQKMDGNTIFYSNWDIIDEAGKKIRSFTESNYNNLDPFDFNVRLIDGQQINVNTSLFPSFLLKNLKMNSDIDPVLVDYDFFLRAGLLHDTKFYLIEKPLIEFRVHQSQLSHQNITSSLKNLKFVSDNILSELPEEKMNQYKKSLKKYEKTKSISKKSLETGLKLISNLLPETTTEKILVFYLNKIRRTR